jgi:hypothetical protein
MIEQLSPALQQEVQPLWAKWPTFLEKLKARVNDVVAEAQAGLDQLIEQHTTDDGPMGAAFSALQARFHGLREKLDQAATKLEELLWDIIFRDDVSQQDCDVASRLHAEISRQRDECDQLLEHTYEQLQTQKRADWARKLSEIVRAEHRTEVECSNCGSPFQLQVYWQASNEPCPHCKAVNSLNPSTAAYSFYQAGVHALAHEQAYAEWFAEQRAKAALDRFRHPTAYDHWQYLQAARTYWGKYYQATQQLHPGFAASHDGVEQAVEAKLAHYTTHDGVPEQQERQFYGELLEALQRRNEAEVRQFLDRRPSSVDVDECARMAMEHDDRVGAALLLGIQHALEDEDEPREQWVRDELRELAQSVREE